MRRLVLCAAIAVILHGAAFVALWLRRDLDLGVQAAIEVALDAVPVPEEAESPKKEPEAQSHRRVTRPPSSGAGAGTPEPMGAKDVASLAPVSGAAARLVVAVHTASLRNTRLADVARSALRLLPDYEMAVAARLDPIDDFDALLIATANPYDVTQTFLAALLADAEKVRARLSAPGHGDPRQLAYPDPQVVVLGRPEHLERVGDRWVQRLRALTAQWGSATLLEVSIGGLSGMLDLGTIRVALPRKVIARMDRTALLRARLEFARAEDAATLVENWPELSARVESSALLRLVGLAGVTKSMNLSLKDSVVEITDPVEERHLWAIANVLRLALDRAHRRWNDSTTHRE